MIDLQQLLEVSTTALTIQAGLRQHCDSFAQQYADTIRPVRNLSAPKGQRASTSHFQFCVSRARFETRSVHLGIEAEILFFAPTALLLMPEDRQQFIEEFLGRVVGGEVPRLSLTGFREEREKFPKRWEFVMDRLDSYKDEIRGMQDGCMACCAMVV
jgi:hypothetical protein